MREEEETLDDSEEMVAGRRMGQSFTNQGFEDLDGISEFKYILIILF